MKDKKFTTEHRAKISKANSGKKRSAEACANNGKGKKCKNLGKYRKKQDTTAKFCIVGIKYSSAFLFWRSVLNTIIEIHLSWIVSQNSLVRIRVHIHAAEHPPKSEGNKNIRSFQLTIMSSRRRSSILWFVLNFQSVSTKH